MFNIASSFFILIAVVLTIIVFVSLIGWWRGVDNVVFPGLGLIAATPAIIVFLLILLIISVLIAAAIKPPLNSTAEQNTKEKFEHPNDIFSGCGNGTLSLSISKDPKNYDPKTDRNLEICIGEDDLLSIQDFVISGRMKYDNLSREDFEQSNEQNQKTFQKFAAAYPMLGKINDIYEDYIFNVEDIKKLRLECLKLQSQNPNLAADLALRKFIYACDEALKENYSLMFGSD